MATKLETMQRNATPFRHEHYFISKTFKPVLEWLTMLQVNSRYVSGEELLYYTRNIILQFIKGGEFKISHQEYLAALSDPDASYCWRLRGSGYI